MSDTTSTRSQQDEEQKTDSRGDVIDMSANIPEGQERAEHVDRDMDAKTDDLGEGLHKNSVTFGTVVSDYETDAEGLTPQKLAENTWGAGSIEARKQAENA